MQSNDEVLRDLLSLSIFTMCLLFVFALAFAVSHLNAPNLL